MLRDKAGWEVGGLIEGLSAETSENLSEPLSEIMSLKLKRALVLVGAGLIIAGVMFFRKSK